MLPGVVKICKICIYEIIPFLFLLRYAWSFGILDCGLRPLRAVGSLYEPEAGGGIGAYPPAYKPTGWKRPRRDFGLVESLRSINYNGQNSLNLKSKLKNLKFLRFAVPTMFHTRCQEEEVLNSAGMSSSYSSSIRLATGFTNSIFSITRTRTTAWTRNNLIDNSEHYDLSLRVQTVSYQL